MTFFPRRSIVSIPFALAIAIFLGSAEAEMIHGSGYIDNFVTDQFDDEPIRPEFSEPHLKLDPNNLEQARRTISHLSPEARRFLFSPMIQNTVTNLNQNSNTQAVKTVAVEGSEGKENKRGAKQVLGYLNPQSGAVEYDIKGKVNKVCFVVG